MPAGRPSACTPDMAARICDGIASGRSLRSLCDDEAMPSKSMVMRWLAKEEHSSFREQYARARECQMDAMAEEILEIADDGTNDWMEKSHGEDRAWVQNGEAMQRSKLRLDARKWLMSKLAAKKYGDKIMTVHTGADGGPVQTQQISSLDEIEARLRRLAVRETVADAPSPAQPVPGGRVVN